jgi:AraC-like DNA-binding protein
MPRAVEFDYRAPSNVAPYARLFGPRVKFGRPGNVITFDRAVLAVRLPAAADGLLEMLREVGDRLRSETVTVHDITNEVHREIASRLATGAPFDLDQIAATLGLTARALQYRLDLHKTSYEAILVETRRRLAERYLRDTDLAITEISDRLGFSELSAFTRAAQRWFQMPPRAYRNHVRGRVGDARAAGAPAYGRGVKATPQPARGGSARKNLAGAGSPEPRSSRQ